MENNVIAHKVISLILAQVLAGCNIFIKYLKPVAMLEIHPCLREKMKSKT